MKTVALEDYLKSRDIHHVDLIKLDVERHEPAVIRGLGSSLRRSRPTFLMRIGTTTLGPKFGTTR